MLVQLGEADYTDFGFWDRLKMAFLPTHIEHDHKAWQYIYYKIYKGRRVVVGIERHH